MCTLSWLADEDGYALAFNRDERNERGAELAPRDLSHGGVRYLAATDSEGGGHWALVNEYGVSLGLLNGYTEGPGHRNKWRSRGLLLRDLSDARDCDAVLHKVAAPGTLDLYKPLVLFVRAPGQEAMILEWDGSRWEVRLGDHHSPLSSSSKNPAEALKYRRALHREMVTSQARTAGEETGPSPPELLVKFHQFVPADGPGPLTPCMQRADASTRSISLITVTKSEVSLAYAPGRPDRTALLGPWKLPRK